MNRNYLILGASSDVGIELLREINTREQSSMIWAHFCSNDKEIKNIKELNDNKIIPISADFSNMDSVDNLYCKIKKTGAFPSSIVHLPAPKLKYEKFKNLSWDDCLYDMQIQVGSVFRILQLLLPKALKNEHRAKIVFMLSENTVNNPSKFSTKYTMSKYMLLGLMKSLASEYKGKNVNINALSPSMIDTKLLSEIDRRMLEVYGATEDMLLPKDVVPWLLKLLSEESDDMNGENIYFKGENNSVR